MSKTFGGHTLDFINDQMALYSNEGDVLQALVAHIRTLEAANARLTAERDAMAKHAFSELNRNVGHGHVYPRPDGNRMRCGGPRVCPDCARDFAALEALRDKLKGQSDAH